jgi:6,7-dimethyl-8-ribityllumazine synthase
MATKNLSEYNESTVRSAKNMKFGIIAAEWNNEITDELYKGAYSTLIKYGAKKNHIITKKVPGCFEISFGASLLAENTDVDAVICIGCVIQGETPHFKYICQSVTYGITKLNLIFNIPFIFGILTTNDKQQAIDRCGGKLGNKGVEAAITAIKMVELKNQF